MIFNGETRDYFVVIKGIDLPIATSKTNEVNNHKRLKRSILEPRIITVPFLIKYKNYTDLQRKKEDLSKWLIHSEVKKLEFKDDETRHYLALVNGNIELEENLNWATGEIEFICPDGFKHGKHKSLILTPTEESHEITGQLPTHWKSRTTFTAPRSSFEIESPGGKIKLTYNFVKGDVLEIDSYSRTIKLNNSIDLDVGLSLNSRWFVLKPNYMTLRANHETTVHYTEKYY